MSVLAAIANANRTKRPEDSVALRATTLGSVLIAVVAVYTAGAAPFGDVALALVLLPVGAWLSHRRRQGDNLALKLVLTAGAVLALWRFFDAVRISVTIDDTRAPLAALFLAVQVLHGFDLPQRRDLGFTLASSLALIALAGVSTHAGMFGVLLLCYAALAGASLAGLQRSAARERADERVAEAGLVPLAGADTEIEQQRLAHRARSVATSVADTGMGLLRSAGPVFLVGTLVFLLLPRSERATVGTLPFHGFPSISLASSRVHNPGLPGGGDAPGDAGTGPPAAFNPTAYFGFAEYVDLRSVGKLAHEPVLRVRADRPRLWRGMVFDTYDGRGWTRSDTTEPRPTYGIPVQFGPQNRADELGRPPQRVPTEQLVQTFEILHDTPNLVFGAAEAREVYLSAGAATRWPDGTITTSGVQDAGTVYSVVSDVVTAPRADLRAAAGPTPPSIAASDLQLPDTVPTRVTELARRLTADAPTNYTKAEAVEDWIGANTSYTLDAPPPPAGGDVVDHFLFTTRAGWCEPIATSMVVLLRSVGVPARFATGFQPGRRNPITGVWDVTMADAHAWVEVWVPRFGWMPFDPTGAVPAAVDPEAHVNRVPLLEVTGWMGRHAAALVPAPVRRAAASAGRSLADPRGATGAGLLGLVAAALWWFRRRRHRAAAVVTPFDRLTALLETEGLPREVWQTPREYVAMVSLRRPDLPAEALRTIRDDEEERRYGASGTPPAASSACEAALTAVREHLARGRDGMRELVDTSAR